MDDKRARFVSEYLIDRNATQAAIRAGYSPKTAKAQGSRLLTYADVRRKVGQETEKQLERKRLTADEVMEAIARVVRADVRDLFDDAGNLKPIKQLTAEQASLLAGLEIIKKNAEAGDGKIDTVHKVKLKDVSRYVEMAAKHFALLTDVVKVSTDETRLARLLAGRQRAAKKGEK